MILIIDTETSNLGTWMRLLNDLNKKFVLSSDKTINFDNISKIIFPGIGNFGRVVSNLKKKNFFYKLIELIEKDIPYLGVCIGMQILFEESEESPKTVGMKILKGKVKKIDSKDLSCPHNGWNNIKIINDANIFKYIDKNKDLYFNHSYYCSPELEKNITSKLSDNSKIITSIQKKMIFGVQFHPEKSMIAGTQIIKNFLDLKC